MSRRQPHQRSTAERGFGREHQKRRLEVKRLVDAGAAKCYRCGGRITPGQSWHLDHADVPGAHKRGIYGGPSHSWCNLAARNQRIAALARQALGGPRADAREQPPVPVSCGGVLRYVPATRAWRAERWSRMNCSTIQFVNTKTIHSTIPEAKQLRRTNAAEDPPTSRISPLPRQGMPSATRRQTSTKYLLARH